MIGIAAMALHCSLQSPRVLGSSRRCNLSSQQQQQPKWFTPARMLIIFCAINMLNYLDRGVIASNGVNGAPSSCKAEKVCTKGHGIQGDFKLSNFQDGVLSSAFMGGLLVASLVFAQSAKRWNPFRLIGVGLTVWTIATAGCGFSFGFWSIVLCRILVGVGEASFVSLAAPFIDDYAPTEKKSTWFAYFYACIPVGIALGYVFGGVVGGHLHWRAAFLIEALLMLPFAVFGFVSAPINLKSGTVQAEAVDTAEQTDRPLKVSNFKEVLNDFKQLFQNKTYSINVLGYIAFNFVLGAYAYWGPKAGKSIYHMKSADILFGAITIVCGVTGTFAGGKFLDFLGFSIRNGFKLLAIASFVGGVFCFFAFMSRSLVLFIFLFAIGELFLFATQGPVNQLTVESVSKELRPLAMASCTVLIHVFGDVPSSPVVGAVEDKLQNWRKTTLLLTSVLLLATVFWGLGFFLLYRGCETSKDDDEQPEEAKQQEEQPTLIVS